MTDLRMFDPSKVRALFEEKEKEIAALRLEADRWAERYAAIEAKLADTLNDALLTRTARIAELEERLSTIEAAAKLWTDYYKSSRPAHGNGCGCEPGVNFEDPDCGIFRSMDAALSPAALSPSVAAPEPKSTAGEEPEPGFEFIRAGEDVFAGILLSATYLKSCNQKHAANLLDNWAGRIKKPAPASPKEE